MSISAKIIADSINPVNKRLTTFVLKFPRIILAEVNTHRSLSKNSSSSRAIPFSKLMEMVKEDPFVPIRFQKEHKGMQGTEYYEGEGHQDCRADWLLARDAAVEAADSFIHPITKQLRNRLLEPFVWQTVILTGTDFENFFALRAHEDAEIHLANLAFQMLSAYNESEPKSLRKGQWHLPFGEKIDEAKLLEHYKRQALSGGTAVDETSLLQGRIKVSVARCARTSYLNFNGKDDYGADIALCDKLFGSTPMHLSPTEHVAECLEDDMRYGNFSGFKQYRYFFPLQNLSDPRVLKKTWQIT